MPILKRPLTAFNSRHSLLQSEIFAEALKKAGAEHQLVVVKDAPHAIHLQPKQQDLRPIVLAFFDKHLKPAKK